MRFPVHSSFPLRSGRRNGSFSPFLGGSLMFFRQRQPSIFLLHQFDILPAGFFSLPFLDLRVRFSPFFGDTGFPPPPHYVILPFFLRNFTRGISSFARPVQFTPATKIFHYKRNFPSSSWRNFIPSPPRLDGRFERLPSPSPLALFPDSASRVFFLLQTFHFSLLRTGPAAHVSM